MKIKTMKSIDLIELRNEEELLQYILDVLQNLSLGKITIDESERLLFLPRNISIIKNITLDKRILDIVEDGFVLDDINDLMSDEFSKEIERLKKETEKLLDEYLQKKKI